MDLMSILWSAAVPTMPLVVPNGHLVGLVLSAMLLLCVAALWFERDRSHVVHHPGHLPEPMGLAA